MKSSLKTSIVTLALTSLLSVPPAYSQGPLTPPPGADPAIGPVNALDGLLAPQATMKTLHQVEPRTPVDASHTPGDASSAYIISLPGSYYLTGNLTGTSGKNGIMVTADNVTLDLQGFSLTGVPGSLSGIVADNRRNFRFLNGTLREWGSTGIQALSSSGGHFEQLRADSNGSTGILAYFNCNVTNCVAVLNGGDGIYVAQGSTVTGCTANSNVLVGISTGGNCTLAHCTTRGNQGFAGVYLYDDSSISHCTAAGNVGFGISLGQFGVATGCTFSSNGSHGVFVNSQHTLIDRCAVAFNRGDGIHIPSYGKGNRITGCVVSGSGTPAVPTNGIVAAASAFIDGCSVTANNATGISAGADCRITNCQVVNNSLNGILAGDRAHVAGNEVNGNGTIGVRGGGIHITGNHGRIDGNHVSTNKKDGLLLDTIANGGAVNTTGNFVSGNTARNNTDMNFRITGNEVGPFQTLSTATSPFANFQ